MIYTITRIVTAPIFKLFYRLSVSGRDRLSDGPMLIVANHTSYLDPVIIGLAVPRRPVAFMAKEELFKVPMLGWYIRKLGAFPVKRNTADRQAIKSAVNILRRGEIVCVFPEGGRNRERLAEALPGAALLALKTKTPILPAAISGADQVWTGTSRRPRFPKIQVKFGRPFEIDAAQDKKTALTDATKKIMDDINNLLGERAG